MTFLERLWAYVTLGAMGFVWEEASPLIGGVAAHDRHLSLAPVIIAVALGTWLAGLGLYALGRWQGIGFRKRWPRLRTVVLQAAAIVRRHPWRASLLARFAYGLRIPVPLACGAARVPLWLYATGTAVSCVVWSAVFTVLGLWLGRTAELLLGQLRVWVPVIGTALVALMIVGYIISRRRHQAERTARALDRERRTKSSPPSGIQPS